jgi:hypothetical protein
MFWKGNANQYFPTKWTKRTHESNAGVATLVSTREADTSWASTAAVRDFDLDTAHVLGGLRVEYLKNGNFSHELSTGVRRSNVQTDGLDAHEVLARRHFGGNREVVFAIRKRRGPSAGVGNEGWIDDALLGDLCRKKLELALGVFEIKELLP